MEPRRLDLCSECLPNDHHHQQDKLYKEMRGRIKEEDSSVPTRYKGFWYYSRTGEGEGECGADARLE